MGMGFQYLMYLGVVGEDEMRSWGWPLFLLNAGTGEILMFVLIHSKNQNISYVTRKR